MPRSSLSYEPVAVSDLDLALMAAIDQQYLETPFYGSRRMTAWLRTVGHEINRKHVQRLMRTMGLAGLAPGPETSRRCPEHPVYPYLLRGLTINRPNQVWAADITYIRLARGFGYLVAIMDWFSRYVLAWSLSNTLEPAFCVDALEQALPLGPCEIFNTDQGSQFTSAPFTGVLKDRGVAISMDGRGRFVDNIFVERLWRSVKYEEVYIHDYGMLADARRGLDAYLRFYNERRLHQALGYRTPASVWRGAPQ